MRRRGLGRCISAIRSAHGHKWRESMKSLWWTIHRGTPHRRLLGNTVRGSSGRASANLSATRNAGAREAHSDVLFFVDADTTGEPASRSVGRCGALAMARLAGGACHSLREGFRFGGSGVSRFRARCPGAPPAGRLLPVLHSERLRGGRRFK